MAIFGGTAPYLQSWSNAAFGPSAFTIYVVVLSDDLHGGGLEAPGNQGQGPDAAAAVRACRPEARVIDGPMPTGHHEL